MDTKAPLVAVETTMQADVLTCGHLWLPWMQPYRPAKRRRCLACYAEQQPAEPKSPRWIGETER